MRDGARIPWVPWQGLGRAEPTIERRDDGARERPPVLALRAEPKVCAHLAAQPEVGDQLRPGQGQEVQVPARPRISQGILLRQAVDPATLAVPPRD